MALPVVLPAAARPEFHLLLLSFQGSQAVERCSCDVGLRPRFQFFGVWQRARRGDERPKGASVASGTDDLERAVASACGRRRRARRRRASGGTLQVTVERAEGLDLDVRRRGEPGDLGVPRRARRPRARRALRARGIGPGLERRLRRPEQFRRAVGTIVSVRTLAGVPGDRRVDGVLRDVDDEGFTITSRSTGRPADCGLTMSTAPTRSLTGRRRCGRAGTRTGDATIQMTSALRRRR